MCGVLLEIFLWWLSVVNWNLFHSELEKGPNRNQAKGCLHLFNCGCFGMMALGVLLILLLWALLTGH